METSILAPVELKEILEHINATKFFREYLPHIKNVKHKMRGTDGNKKPISFSDQERKEIVGAIKRFCDKMVKEEKG